MTLTTFGLVLLSVMMSALAQICLKLGMSSPAVQQAFSSSKAVAIYTVASNPAVLGGLTLYGLGAMIWLLVLARVNVSIAYPLVSIGFILTAAFAVLILGEPVSKAMMIGTVLITIGVVILARG
jgi:multidrug transporter EmrE-like cation transporter